MGSMNVSSCRFCMFVSCVHPVAILNAALCMTCSLLMLVEDGRGILQSLSHDCLIGSASCIISTRYSEFCIYQMQFSLYLPDSAKTMYMPVGVWCGDRTPP